MEIKIRGKITGDYETRVMFSKAPKVMAYTVKEWFFSIMKKFVGFKKSKAQGRYIKYLQKRKLKDRPGNWSNQAAGAFKGFVKAKNRLDAMTLVMGIPPTSRSGFVQGLRGMAAGGFSINTSHNMIVPNTENLVHYGITKRFYENFVYLLHTKQIYPVQHYGKVLYINEKDHSVMYVGTPKVNIPSFAFEFEEKFRTMMVKEIGYGQNRIDRAVRALNTGRIKVR